MKKHPIVPLALGQRRRDPGRRYEEGMGNGRPAAPRIVEVVAVPAAPGSRVTMRDEWSGRESHVARKALERWAVEAPTSAGVEQPAACGRCFSYACSAHAEARPKSFFCCTCGRPMAWTGDRPPGGLVLAAEGVAAIRHLLRVLEECHATSREAFVMAAIHGYAYQGPSWTEAVTAVAALLPPEEKMP